MSLSQNGISLNEKETLKSPSFPNIVEHKRVLGTIFVASITFFNVSGGPFGSEESISAAGPLPGLIGLLIFPVIWAIPLALVTAELSTAFPDDGGYSIWVTEAFGEFWGIQESWWSWCSGVVDNAVYPVLMYQSLASLFKIKLTFWAAYFAKATIAILFSLPNIVTVKEVGKSMSLLAMFVSLPFLVLIVMGVPKIKTSHLVKIWNNKDNPRSYKFKNYRHLLSVLYWSFSGFDGVSTSAGEIMNPGETVPKGLFFAFISIVLITFLPLFVATAVNEPKWETWKGGTFPEIADHLGGHYLGHWVLVASIAGSLGLYISELFTDSWQLLGMAECGLAPSIFAKRNASFGTPVNAILASLVVILFLVYLDFDAILVVDNFFSASSTLLEILAFAKLRDKLPDLERPFRAPCTGWTVWLLLFLPIVLSVCIMLNELTKSFRGFFINICALAFGILIYAVYKPSEMEYKSPRLRPHYRRSSSIESLQLGRPRKDTDSHGERVALGFGMSSYGSRNGSNPTIFSYLDESSGGEKK